MTELLGSPSSPSRPDSQTPTRRGDRSQSHPRPQRRRGPGNLDTTVRPERRPAAKPPSEREQGAPKGTESPAVEPITPRLLPLAHEAGIARGERRKRLEGIVLKLAQTPDFALRLSGVYERHTRREINAAAALRPELMPTLNGEFEHFAFFAP